VKEEVKFREKIKERVSRSSYFEDDLKRKAYGIKKYRVLLCGPSTTNPLCQARREREGTDMEREMSPGRGIKSL